jgi:hypothetical protein
MVFRRDGWIDIIKPMRRSLALILLSLMLACRAVTALPTPTVTPPSTPTQLPTVTPASTPTLEASTPALAQPPQPEAPFALRYHPDGGLYVGDKVSFEVIAPQGINVNARHAVVAVEGLPDARFGPAEFGRYGIAGRSQATLMWAWDTSSLPAGDYTLDFSIEPDGWQWTETVALLPEKDLPVEEKSAHWASAESDCCLLYYITGTEAQRDLPKLLEMADEQAASVADRFQAKFSGPVTLVMLPRVLGHGGFTNKDISISYLDRRYTGGDTDIVLHHELVHYLDNQLGGALRPTILLEGLAVYLSGGHFKPETLLPRAAALLELGWYQPLDHLADDFYPSQHEIGYMEAGALVEYMVDRWGWQSFNDFYRDIQPGPQGGSQSGSIDTALTRRFNTTFAQLEADFLTALRAETVAEQVKEDVRLTIAFYDTARRYQKAFDPSAYYLTTWLPDGKQMRERGIVADYLRHPSAPTNIVLETLLVSAYDQLRAGNYDEAERLIETVNQALSNLAPTSGS